MSQSCGNCPTPTGDGQFLCHRCCEALEWDLAEVNALWEDLQVTVAKLDKGAESVGSGGHAGSSAPVNLTASERGQTLTAVLTGWVTVLGHQTRDPLQASDVLLSRIREVRTQEWAPDLLRELHEAMGQCRAATDRAAELVVIGRCQTVTEGERCPDVVKAIQGATHGRCRTCGTKVDILEHQQELIQAAGHVRAPLPKLVRALRGAGHLPGVSLKRVENWVARRKLSPVIPFRALYTASDIMDTYLATEAYNAELAERRAARLAEKELAQTG